DAATGVKAGDVGWRGGRTGRKITAEENLAITLHGKSSHVAQIRCRARIKSEIDGAVRIQAGDIKEGGISDRSKGPADEDLAIGLQEDNVDLSAGIQGW